MHTPLPVLGGDLDSAESLVEYIQGVHCKLFLSWRVKISMSNIRSKTKQHYDRTAVVRAFSPGV